MPPSAGSASALHSLLQCFTLCFSSTASPSDIFNILSQKSIVCFTCASLVLQCFSFTASVASLLHVRFSICLIASASLLQCLLHCFSFTASGSLQCLLDCFSFAASVSASASLLQCLLQLHCFNVCFIFNASASLLQCLLHSFIKGALAPNLQPTEVCLNFRRY